MTTILLIEDEPVFAELYTIVLQRAGYTVLHAANGTKGLLMARQRRPDLIVCDIMMPDLNGHQVLQRIRADQDIAAIPFIFLTVLDNEKDVREGMNLTADDYVSKSLSSAELLHAIASTIKRRAIIAQTTNQPKKQVTDVFISYSRKDSTLMGRVRDSLRESGYTVWTDEQIPPGEPDWSTAIVDAIRSAQCVVVLLSPDAERSRHVNEEIAVAEDLLLPIIPVLIRGSEIESVPPRLIYHQWIEARFDYNGAMEKLATAIKGALDRR